MEASPYSSASASGRETLGRKSIVSAMAGKAIPLAKFLDGAGPADDLPKAPVAASQDEKGTKYVMEWNGNGPLPLPPDVVKANENQKMFTASNRLITKPPQTVEEFKARISESILEYFDSADVMEVIRQLEELRMPLQHHQLVRRAIILSIERSDREREMAAVLISSLYVRRVISSTQVFDAFISLLESAEDIMIDNPACDGQLAHFLADAVLDGCLTPTFILEPPPLSVNLAASARAVADGILVDAARRLREGTAVAAPTESLAVPLEEVKRTIESMVAEYLQAEDVGEVARRLREGQVLQPLRHEVVKRGVRVALQRGPQECEAVSRLLSALYGGVLPAAEIARGFEALLKEAADLALDVPDAPRMLGNFLARAVSDEVVTPGFVDQALRTGHPDPKTAGHAALTRARALLAMGHGSHRMARIWGPRAVAAKATVEEIKAMFKDIVDEFFVGRDPVEAQRSLDELAVPSYHHEWAKKLLRRAVEGTAEERALTTDLLALVTAGDTPTVAKDKVSQGFDRLADADSMADVKLDTPNAEQILTQLRADAAKKGALPP